MQSRTRYTLLQIALHWAIAVLVILNWLLAEDMGDALEARVDAGTTSLSGAPAHVYVGLLILGLVLWRIAVRARRGVPDHATGSPILDKAAHYGHLAIYALLVMVPLGGFFVWFGGLEDAGEAHEIAGQVLVLLALGHAGMALYHHFVRKDGTLTKMTRPET